MIDNYITIYAIVPSYIYKSKKLSAEDKLIAERITALCKKEGYAWITNKTLADMYGIREDTVSRHIKRLKDIGFIKCVYGKNVPNKSKRIIYLSNNIWAKQPMNVRLDSQKDIGLNAKHNNNKINNNMNNIELPMTFDEDGTMLWHGKRCESVPCTKEEEEELKKSIMDCVGDINE